MTMKIRLKVNPRTQQVKEEGLRANDQGKMQLGTRLPFLQIPEERGREQATAAEDIAKNTETTGQKT